MKYDIVIFREFTQPEIDELIEKCNFTPDEEIYFKLRCKNCSNIEISIKLNVSEAQVSKLARRVKNKIKKII